MIAIQAHGWQQFLAAFGVLRGAGVEPIAVGGNAMRVPDDTCRDVLRAVAATGVTVHADLTEPAAAEPVLVVESEGAQDPTTGVDNPPDVADPGSGEQASEPAESPDAADEAPAVKPAPARKATRPRTRKPKEQ